MMSARLFPLLGVGFLLVAFLVAAPNAAGHKDEHEELESPQSERVPNNGAVIRIVSPVDGFVCPAGMEVEICVELEQFALGQAGCHWHISVDGEPWNMIVDDRLKEVLYGLQPGEHRIEVLMADGEHRDLEEGDAITVVVQ
jgi:hypothetical protein